VSSGGSWALLNQSWLWIAALSAVAVLSLTAGAVSSLKIKPSRKIVLLSLRFAALLLLAIAVLRPAREIDLLRTRRPPLAVLVDSSKSMTHGSTPLSKATIDWLSDNAGRLKDLEDFYKIEFVELDENLSNIEFDRLRQFQFDGKISPLGKAIEDFARLRPDCVGAVLLSDGRDTEQPGKPPAAAPFPIYPVVFETEAVQDLWIESIEPPPVSFIRTPTEIKVKLGLSGIPKGQAVVTLLEGGRPLRSETITLEEPGGEVILTFNPTRTGSKAYGVRVTPMPGETMVENNSAMFSLNVIRDKTRVLLVTGTPTWDVKFLRRRLRQDPGIDLISFFILRTPQDSSSARQDELSLIPFPTDELFNAELPSFDIVIFANFDYGPYVPRRYLDNLVRFVRDAGGGFAMLGGDRSFALGGYEGTRLEEILPFAIGGAAPGQRYLPKRFRPRLTEAGAVHPLFRWRSNPEENRLIWNSLPELEGMDWILRAKTGAVVLAENPERRNEYGPLPVVAAGEYGQGRTLAVATDSLWHWALPLAGQGGDPSVYRDFWTRALRWLVHDPEMELVRLSLPAGRIRAGSEIKFRARVFNNSYEPATGAKMSGSVVLDGGPKQALSWSETAPGEYESSPFKPAAEGFMRVEAQAELDATFLGRDSMEAPVEAESPENGRLGVDSAYLGALAEKTGGRVFREDKKDLFNTLLEKGKSEVEVVGRRVKEIWPASWLLGLTIALLGADWALRKIWE